MVTVGSEITWQAEARFRAGDAFAGLALDAIGSWAAEAAAEALMGHLHSQLGSGESFTLRYSPGYCGMDLGQQRMLFKLAPAGSVDISLLPSLLMQPLKSISGIVGLGPREAVGIHLSPCERCPQVGCHMRR
jgi:cobalamin-dependent methionine synthase I